VLVGEAPGEQEADQGIPFVGPSGYLLDKVLKEVNLDRGSIYITNVLPYRPASFSNDIKLVDRQSLARASNELVARLRQRFTGIHPRVVVPTGGTALYALTGKTGINKWRGSIIEADMLWPGQKAIPTLHPAGVLRTPALAKTLILDWRRIKGDAKFYELRIPPREHIINPTAADAEEFEAMVASDPTAPLCFDIETSRDQRIICVGFSLSSDLSITFGFDRFKPLITRLCASPNPKVGQNLMFDIWHLFYQGIEVREYLWDTAAMFHCLDPAPGPTSKGKGNDGGASRLKCFSLAYIQSIRTRFPYHKDDPKDDSEGTRVRDSETWWRDFLTYNGKDCTGEFACFESLYEELATRGKLHIYSSLYSDLFSPLIRLMLGGVRFDVRAASEARLKFEAEARSALARAESLAGRKLHSVVEGAQWYSCDHPKCRGKRHKVPTCPRGGTTSAIPRKVVEGKSISNQKLIAYLYGAAHNGGLGIPKRKKKGHVTCDEAALRGLRLSYPERCGAVVDEILAVRRSEKLGSFVGGNVASPDGRVRSQYKMLVQTGRLSSASNPGGTGANLQNTDAALMYLFKPDKRRIFLRADLSQAEDRVVKVFTGVPRLVAEARQLPATFDTHTEFAATLFSRVRGTVVRPVKGKGEDEVSGEMRQLGKVCRHASNYDMHAPRLAETIAKDGAKLGINRVVSIEECESILAAIRDITPEIRTHFQRPIRDLLREGRVLRNSWGAEIDFGVELRYTLNDNQRGDIYRKAYAWPPQGEVGRLMNQWGLIPLQEWLDGGGADATVNLQRHDELVVSVLPEEAYDAAEFLVHSLERPRLYTLGDGYPRTELVIPVELALGRDGGKAGLLEFKQLSSRNDFEGRLDKWLS